MKEIVFLLCTYFITQIAKYFGCFLQSLPLLNKWRAIHWTLKPSPYLSLYGIMIATLWRATQLRGRWRPPRVKTLARLDSISAKEGTSSIRVVALIGPWRPRRDNFRSLVYQRWENMPPTVKLHGTIGHFCHVPQRGGKVVLYYFTIGVKNISII